MEITWDIYSGRFMYCYRCVSLEIFGMEKSHAIGLHVLGLNRDYTNIRIRMTMFINKVNYIGR
jgi:hypothetical protein